MLCFLLIRTLWKRHGLPQQLSESGFPVQGQIYLRYIIINVWTRCVPCVGVTRACAVCNAMLFYRQKENRPPVWIAWVQLHFEFEDASSNPGKPAGVFFRFFSSGFFFSLLFCFFFIFFPHLFSNVEHSTSSPNERVWRITQLAKLSFNHPSVVLTADVFQFLIKMLVFFAQILHHQVRTHVRTYKNLFGTARLATSLPCLCRLIWGILSSARSFAPKVSYIHLDPVCCLILQSDQSQMLGALSLSSMYISASWYIQQRKMQQGNRDARILLRVISENRK